jgi:tRNA1Val (adenine37-N6)-methyltransferase
MSMAMHQRPPILAELQSLKREDETLDTLFGGALSLLQSRNGYRFSLDPLLLARFVTCRPGEKIADLGSGNGVMALVLAYLHSSLAITGVEIQTSMVDRARRNARMNGFEKRVMILQGDVRHIEKVLRPESFAGVVCNPPYRPTASGRTSPQAERKMARHEIMAGLGDFLRAGAYLLPIKGRMALVYPALRFIELLQSMRRANLEPKRLRVVHSFADDAASLVLVEGVKGGKSGVEVLPPLMIYRKKKQYTDEVKVLLAGKS